MTDINVTIQENPIIVTLAENPASEGGEVNVGENVGTGQSVYKTKVGQVLQFRKIKEGSAKVSVSTNGDSIEVEINEDQFTHNHDDRYFTEAEIGTLLSGKSDTSHTHDDRYYTETETDTLLSGKSDTSHNHDTDYLKKSQNLADVSNRQVAVDTLLDTASANEEYVLTKDTTTGNAIFKAPQGGGGGGASFSFDAELGENLTAGDFVKFGSDGKIYKTFYDGQGTTSDLVQLTTSTTQYISYNTHYNKEFDRVAYFGMDGADPQCWWISFDANKKPVVEQQFELSTRDYRTSAMFYNKNNGKYYFFVGGYSSGYPPKYYIGTPSATSISWSSEQSISTIDDNLNYTVRVAFNPDKDEVAFLFCDSSSSNYVTLISGVVETDGTITWDSTKTQVDTASGTYSSIFYSEWYKTYLITNGTSIWQAILKSNGTFELSIERTTSSSVSRKYPNPWAWIEDEKCAVWTPFGSNQARFWKVNITGKTYEYGTNAGLGEMDDDFQLDEIYVDTDGSAPQGGSPVYIPSLKQLFCFYMKSRTWACLMEKTGSAWGVRKLMEATGSTTLSEPTACWVESIGRFFIGGTSSGIKCATYAPDVLFLNLDQCVGVLQTSGTTGQTKTIMEWGGTDASRTGLTKGSWYGLDEETGEFVEGRGVKVGVATDTDKFKLRK